MAAIHRTSLRTALLGPLHDSYCPVHIGDVRKLLEKHDGDYDAVLLDVDTPLV
ncbi:hypothetical protein [Microbulbifer hainanensis]|uniref:hypothetical protein n=1 Tax=Microbulbifer hainanensis TaxID=2735675 RepID=UPI0018679D3B|nr:hypothetical protein [Microbulbifer hainanensis]